MNKEKQFALLLIQFFEAFDRYNDSHELQWRLKMDSASAAIQDFLFKNILIQDKISR